MKRIILAATAVCALIGLIGCNLTSAIAPTTTATSTVTLTLPSQVTVVTATSQPGAATPTTRPAATDVPTSIPAATSVPATAVPPTVAPTATFRGSSELNIYLIAIGDAGASGTKIGCDDSVIPVKRTINPPTQSPLRTAYTELLSLHDQYYGESGLYNALYQSNLSVSDVNIRNGTAIVALTGTLQQGGECDSPRIKAQLEYTALQFATVTAVQITINGTALDDVLSLK